MKSTAIHLRGDGAGACFTRAAFMDPRKARYPVTDDPAAVTCRRCLRLLLTTPATTSATVQPEPSNV